MLTVMQWCRQQVWSFVALTLVIALWCWPQTSRSKTTPTVAPLELGSADLVLVEQGRIAHDIAITGVLQPLQQVMVTSRVTGVIEQLTVREGDVVSAGQVLVRLNSVDSQSRVAQLSASLQANRAEAELAQQKLERARPLNAKELLSNSELQSAEKQAEIEHAHVKSAEASLAQAQQQLSDSVIRAPFAGVVSTRQVTVGQAVQPNMPLLQVVDLHQLELSIEVPAAEINRIHSGQLLPFQVEGYNQDFQARVVRINPVAQNGSRRVTVYGVVDNNQSLLRGGLLVKGTIRDDRSVSGLSVPLTALQSIEGSYRIYVIRHQALQALVVTVLARDEEQGIALIQGDVQQGEKALLLPPMAGNEGRAVRLAGAH